MNAAEKIQKARIALVLDEPFFGALLLGLKHLEDKEGRLTKTMATDGVSLYWHTPFVTSLEVRELVTILAHEALHAALLHPLRRASREHGLFNQACDHAVNLHLEDCNQSAKSKGNAEPFPWPKLDGILKDARFAGLSAEEIYGQLANEKPEDKPGDDQPNQNGQESPGNGSPGDEQGMGGVLDAPGDESAKQEQEAQWKVGLVQAAQAGKMAGNLPGGIARLVQETLNPPSRWQDILRQFVTARAHTDFSWTKPNMRYASTGFILPSLNNQVLGTIVVAADCSGSMWDKVETVFNETSDILSICKPQRLVFIQFDTVIQDWQELEHGDTLNTEAKGGGGTDFRCIFSELEARDLIPDCIVIVSDGHGNYPKHDPAFPCVWALTKEHQTPPFGQIICLE